MAISPEAHHRQIYELGQFFFRKRPKVENAETPISDKIKASIAVKSSRTLTSDEITKPTTTLTSNKTKDSVPVKCTEMYSSCETYGRRKIETTKISTVPDRTDGSDEVETSKISK